MQAEAKMEMKPYDSSVGFVMLRLAMKKAAEGIPSAAGMQIVFHSIFILKTFPLGTKGSVAPRGVK